MLIQAHKDIIRITDDEQINMENYMESLKHISNLYNFINKIKTVVSTKDMIFYPTFKGMYTSQKLNIEATDKEMEMKVFKIFSVLLLEDTTVEKMYKVMTPLCDSIDRDTENIFTFILK